MSTQKSISHIFSVLFALVFLLTRVGPAHVVPASIVEPAKAVEAPALLQFTAGGHILGFSSSGVYVATGSHAFHVDFMAAKNVQPQAESPGAEGKAAPLSRVQYPNLWQGISLTYDAPSGGLLRSTYQLEAGADVSAIQLRYNAPLTIDPMLTWNTFLGSSSTDDGGHAIAVDGDGNVYLGGSSMAAWGCSPTPCTARAYSGGDDAFVAKLDSSGALKWNTFLGSSGYVERSFGLALDSNGSVYVTGWSTWEWSGAGSGAFVAKLNSSDGALQWATFFEYSIGSAIAVDGSGMVYVAGQSFDDWGCPTPTNCTVRPFTTGASYTENDAFVAKLDSDGVLQWNTFLGGSGDDWGNAIVVDGSGYIDVAGDSDAAWGAPVRPYNPGDGTTWSDRDAFAAKLNASNGELQWNTFLGGSGNEGGSMIYEVFRGMAADGDGNVYVVGDSPAAWGCSPTACTVRAFTPNNLYESRDAYIAKLDANGVLQWNTFLGSSGDDLGKSIAVDVIGNVYVAGTSSDSWGAPGRAFAVGDDAFAAKLNSSGALQWSTFLGGNGEDKGMGLALDISGNVYVAGTTEYVSWGAPLRAFSGGDDIFVAKLSYFLSANASLSNLVFSTGALTPAFAADSTAYTLSVANTITSLTVTPTVQDAAATVTVNGTPVTSGIASGPISLAIGPNTITTVVTAEDGITTKTYTVTVTRFCQLFLPHIVR